MQQAYATKRRYPFRLRTDPAKLIFLPANANSNHGSPSGEASLRASSVGLATTWTCTPDSSEDYGQTRQTPDGTLMGKLVKYSSSRSLSTNDHLWSHGSELTHLIRPWARHHRDLHPLRPGPGSYQPSARRLGPVISRHGPFWALQD